MLRSVAPFVLFMLCLRALVPAGFMLAPVEGRLAIVLCDAGAGHSHPGHHHMHSDPTCPYAQSAGPSPPFALPSLAAPPIAGAPVLPARITQIHAVFGPIRRQSPRAPPTFA